MVRQDAIVALGKHIASMEKEFSAIFITSDQIASYVVQGLVSGGVSVPEEMSVIGFDNLENMPSNISAAHYDCAGP